MKPSYSNVASTLALVAALCGSAIAGSGNGGATAGTSQESATIKACAIKKGKRKGQLRVIATSKRCKRSERQITWNQRGPAGVTGATGATGAAGAAGVAPAGAVVYFDLPACPDGWTAFEAGAGRYLVGTPAAGTNAATVGTALTDKEDRPVGRHAHSVTDPGHTHQAGARNTINAGNVPYGSFQANGSAPFPNAFLVTQTSTTGLTVDAAGGVDGTNAPYVQLLACRKS